MGHRQSLVWLVGIHVVGLPSQTGLLYNEKGGVPCAGLRCLKGCLMGGMCVFCACVMCIFIFLYLFFFAFLCVPVYFKHEQSALLYIMRWVEQRARVPRGADGARLDTISSMCCPSNVSL